MTVKTVTTEFAEQYGPEYGFLDAEAMGAMLGVSSRTIYRMCERGTFPLPRQISAGTRRWWLPDVKKWIKKQPCQMR